MSATLANLLAAARVMSGFTEKPTCCGSLFFWLLERQAEWDAARSAFYTDEASRRVFDWRLRAMGIHSFFEAFKPLALADSPFAPEEWGALEDKARALDAEAIGGDYLLDRIDTWLLESYSLKGLCEVEPGDVVLDCGTFTGNTSLYFAQKAGPSGHVYGFEASPENFRRYRENMRAVSNVTPVRSAVGDHTGETSFCENGPGARVLISGNGVRVPMITLDEFCLKRKLPRVDFIKMDVEGFEEKALRGARRIIQDFRPKMAVSAYHREVDMLNLPSIITNFDKCYTFQLRHFSDSLNETVLYCIPERNAKAAILSGANTGGLAASAPPGVTGCRTGQSPVASFAATPEPSSCGNSEYAELWRLMLPLLIKTGDLSYKLKKELLDKEAVIARLQTRLAAAGLPFEAEAGA